MRRPRAVGQAKTWASAGREQVECVIWAVVQVDILTVSSEII